MIERDRAVHDLSYALQGTSRVASDGRSKVWLDLAGGPPRFYDLQAGEGSPAASLDRATARRLKDALFAWLEREEGGLRAENLRRARESTAQLKALGYL